MSHHLDSPLARQDVRLDLTDLYAFRGEVGTVVVVNLCHSIAAPAVPGYHPEGKYEFKFDLDGDAADELSYRLVFGQPTEDGTQHYEVTRLEGGASRDPFGSGTVVAEGVTGAETLGSSGERVWAGKAGDAFWIDPSVLQAVGQAFHDGTTIDLGSWTPTQAVNLFAGHSVYSIVLELPDNVFSQRSHSAQIGIWALASLQTDAGGWRPINRIGLPMIHPLFAQFDDHTGDHLNGGHPADDEAQFGDLFRREIAGVVAAAGTSAHPDFYAHEVVARLLPNILRYEVGSAASFGFAGWNGRTLTDNAVDVVFSLATNSSVSTGLDKDSVTEKPSSTFPYVPAVPRGR